MKIHLCYDKMILCLGFFALVLSSGFWGPLSEPLTSIGIIISLMTMGLFLRLSSFNLITYSLLMFLVILPFSSRLPASERCILIGIFFYLLIFTKKEYKYILVSLCKTSLLLSLIILINKISTFFWHFHYTLSEQFAYVMSLLNGVVLVGTASGLPIVLTMILLIFLSIDNKRIRSIKFWICLIFISLLILYIHGWVVRFNTYHKHLPHQFGWNCMPMPALILFDVSIMSLLTLYFFHSNQPFQIDLPLRRGRIIFAVLISFISLCMLYRILFPSHQKVDTGRILLVDEYPLDWNKPVKKKYGIYSFGMFGMLEDYLEDWGFQVKKGKLTPNNLAESDGVIFFNMGKKLEDKQKTDLWEFIAKGGGVLLAGDHTGYETIRKPMNDLLNRISIRLQFDSAVPLRDRWVHAIQMRNHAITKAIQRGEKAHIQIGASLKVDYPSSPLLVGEFGFSDPGERSNTSNGYLGNLSYDTGERLGGVILAAAQNYQKGRIIVFGDTTTFQNGSLPYSYPFVHQIANWLSQRDMASNLPQQIIILVIVIACGLILITRKREIIIGMLLLPIWVSTFLYIESSIAEVKLSQKKEFPAVLIQDTHLTRFTKKPWESESVDSLMLSFMRMGYLPYLGNNETFHSLPKAKVLVMIAPTKPFSQKEKSKLNAWIKQGGQLLVSSGFEEAIELEHFLEDYSLNILPVSLGTLSVDENNAGIEIRDAWAVRDVENNSRVFAEAFEYPFIIKKPIGKGAIILIGSTSFLYNQSLEDREGYIQENIEFLYSLFQENEERS